MTNLILAGVDGSGSDEAVLRYAAGVSTRTGADVRLAHVAGSYTSMLPVVDVDFDEAGQAVAREALARARELMPSAKVDAVVVHGQRQVALLEAARESCLVVLGKQHRNRLERLFTGSTVTALAAQATVPVVVVPDTYAGDVHGAVGVGVKTLEGTSVMVAEAARIAAARGARLEVVHAWHLPVAAYDALSLPGTVDTEAWSEDMRKALDEEVRNVLADHPQVEVSQSVVEAHPANALAELADRVDLLVLARRTRIFPRGHLGGTARTLLREAPCPVVVVPPRFTDESGEPVL